jgi:hypothetical protein
LNCGQTVVKAQRAKALEEAKRLAVEAVVFSCILKHPKWLRKNRGGIENCTILPAGRIEMAKPPTKIIRVITTIERGNVKLGEVGVERLYISWKPAGARRWKEKTWNQFHDWMTGKQKD